MPKEELKIELIKECKAEIKFIQSHGNVNASNQPIYKPSSIATQFLAMNDIKPLKKVGLFLLLLLWIWDICDFLTATQIGLVRNQPIYKPSSVAT